MPRGFFLSFFGLVAISLGFLPLAGCGQPPDDQTWRIGVIVPTSGSLAAYGVSTHRGIGLMVERINAQGGIHGKKIELFVENNEGHTGKTAEAFRKLAGLNRVLAVVGPITSTNCLNVTRDAQRKGVALITPTGTNDSITRDGDFIFRACFNDSLQGIAVARFAFEDLQIRSAVSFQDTASDYSVGLCGSFNETFAQLGGKVFPILSYKKADTDFTPQLRKVRESGAQGLFVPGYPPELPLIVNQAKTLGLECVLLGADGWDNDAMPENAGANLDGSYFSAAFSTEMSTPELESFLALTRKAGIQNPGSFEALGYDAVGLIAEAIRQANPEPGDLQTRRRAVRDALAAIRDYKGATGSITMQESGDPIKSLVILRYEAAAGKVNKTFVKIVEPETE